MKNSSPPAQNSSERGGGMRRKITKTKTKTPPTPHPCMERGMGSGCYTSHLIAMHPIPHTSCSYCTSCIL